MNTFSLLLSAAFTGLASLPAFAAGLPFWSLAALLGTTFGLVMVFTLELKTVRPAALRTRPGRASAAATVARTTGIAFALPAPAAA